MVKLTCCPECNTIYNLEGIDLSSSKGWVQCGDCNTKFESELHAIDEIPTIKKATKEKQDTKSEDVFLEEKTTSNKKSTQKDVAVDDFLFDAEDIDKSNIDNYSIDIDSEDADEEDSHQKFRNAFLEPVSEFAEDPVEIEPVDKTRKTPLEEELENNRLPKETKGQKFKAVLCKYVCAALTSAVFICLLLVLILQLQGRGVISAIPDKQYANLLEKYPTLQIFEKSKSDLSNLSIVSSELKRFKRGLAIRLKLVNKSILKQNYPSLELEFQDSKGEAVARKLVTPDMYLKKGFTREMLGKQTRSIYLSLFALPQGAVGYQVKIVNNPG